MKKWSTSYHPKVVSTSEFGDWNQFQYKDKYRVAFQPYRIFIGDFDPEVDNNPEYVLRRILDADYNPSHSERLHGEVPIPEGAELVRQYFTDIRPSSSTTLKDPTVYTTLPIFSPAVHGVSILQNHLGIILEYAFALVKDQKQLERDIELAVKVYERITQL